MSSVVEYYFGVKSDTLNQMIVAVKMKHEENMRITHIMNGCDFHGRCTLDAAKRECRSKMRSGEWYWIQNDDVAHMLPVESMHPLKIDRINYVLIAATGLIFSTFLVVKCIKKTK